VVIDQQDAGRTHGLDYTTAFCAIAWSEVTISKPLRCP
jgi:hypothetical protein